MALLWVLLESEDTPGSIFHVSPLPNARVWVGGGMRIFSEAVRNLVMENGELGGRRSSWLERRQGSLGSHLAGRSSRFRSSLCPFQRLLTSIQFSKVFSVLRREGTPWCTQIMVCMEAVLLTAKPLISCWIYKGSVSNKDRFSKVWVLEPKSQIVTNDLCDCYPVPMICLHLLTRKKYILREKIGVIKHCST